MPFIVVNNYYGSGLGYGRPMAVSRTRSLLRKIVGILAAVAGGLWVASKLAADWIGRTTLFDDYALLRQRLGPMMEAIAHQPALWWYGAAAVLVGFSVALLWPSATPDVPIPTDAPTPAPAPTRRSEFPDWPIYELLWKLAPHLPRDPMDNRWGHHIGEVRNKLSLGRLKATAISHHPDKPEDWVDRAYWASVELSRNAIDEGYWEIGVTSPTSQRWPWLSHLKVSKAEAYEIWPDLDERKPFDIALNEAFAGIQKLRSCDLEEAKAVVRSATRLKFVTLWGMPGPTEGNEPIPHDIFDECEFELFEPAHPSLGSVRLKSRATGKARFAYIWVLSEPLMQVAAEKWLPVREVSQPSDAASDTPSPPSTGPETQN